MANPRALNYPRRGAVYLVNFEPVIGSEIRKTRPALILQNDVANRYSPLTIVSAITSQYEEPLYPTEVLLRAGEGGTKVTSVILLNPIIEIAIGTVPHSFAEFGPDRSWVTVVPVRRNPGRRDAGDRLGRTEERPGGGHVACLAQPHVHQSTRRVDGAIEIAPPALDFDVGVSGAGQLQPRALSEPDVILSHHPAPIVRTRP